MQIGTQTNSLVNHLYSRGVIGQPEPEIGMGVTFLSWTDRHAGTIQRVFKIGKLTAIEATQDDARLLSGSIQSETQRYEFTERPNAYRSTYRREANGMWSEVRFNAETKRWTKTGGFGLRIGAREEYCDPSF